MALLSPQVASIVGTAVTFAAASAGGDTFTLNARSVLHVKNASGGSINVTLAVPGNNEDAQPNPDPIIAVAAGAEKIIGPFSTRHVDPADNLIHIAYSASASVTVALVAC